MTEEEKQERNRIRNEIMERHAIESVRNYLRNEEKRLPFLRFRRRLRGLPEPKVTAEQAIEIARDYLVNVKGYPESIREVLLMITITSTLQAYLIWPTSGRVGIVSLKVDMDDGRIYDVIAPDGMM